MLPICKCGCGNNVIKASNMFLQGHNQKGKNRSIEAIEKQKKTMLDPIKKAKFIENIKSKWTPERKAKMSDFNLGKILTDSHKEKIGLSNKGKVRSDEYKRKISDSLKTYYEPYDYRKNQSDKAKGKNKGELNGNFKHGKSSENRKARQTFEYKQWRKAVFERDNYTCQDCGVIGVYVTAHHIKSFAQFKELRYELSNGQTLCEPCHEKTDNYKGLNRNKQQLINKLWQAQENGNFTNQRN